MSYSQTMSTSTTTVTRKFSWYATTSPTNSSLCTTDTLLFTRPDLTDATTVANFVIEKGCVGKYIWVKLEVSANGYETQTKYAYAGAVKADSVTPTFTATTGATESGTLFGIGSAIKVTSVVGVQNSEFGQTYDPSAYGSGDNTTTDSGNLQTKYEVTISKTYNWVYSEKDTAPTDSTVSGSDFTSFGTTATAVIPAGAINKYVFCLISYTLSDSSNYTLSKTYDVKSYTNKVANTTLTLTIGAYDCDDARNDNVSFGIHDNVIVSVTKATDGVTTYDNEEAIKALGLESWTWTWKAVATDGTEETVDSSLATTSNDGLTSTVNLAKGNEFVGKRLAVSVSASSDTYSAAGTKASEYSTAISVANVSINTLSLNDNFVYGDNQNILKESITTDDATDVTGEDCYWAIDVELDKSNYFSKGTKLTNLVPNTTAYDATTDDNSTHTLYIYYPGDADHNESDNNGVFKIAKADRTITITNASNDTLTSTSVQYITYGESADYSYKITAITDATSDVTVSASQGNLTSITTDGTTSKVANNSSQSISTGNVTAFIDDDTVITISSEATTNYNAVSGSFPINTVKRSLTITDATIDDTTPVYDDELTVTKGTGSTYGNDDVEANVFVTSYQWYEASTADGEGTAISGATKSTYTPTASQADGGKFVYCVVSYTTTGTTKGANYTLSTTSTRVDTTNAVAKRTMSIELTLSGNAIYGQVLTTNATVTDNTVNTK